MRTIDLARVPAACGPRQVRIRHRTLGIAHKALMVVIFLYVIVYTIIIQKARGKPNCARHSPRGGGSRSRSPDHQRCCIGLAGSGRAASQKYNITELPTGSVTLSVMQPGPDNRIDPDVERNWVSNKVYCKPGLDKSTCDGLKSAVGGVPPRHPCVPNVRCTALVSRWAHFVSPHSLRGEQTGRSASPRRISYSSARRSDWFARTRRTALTFRRAR